MNEEQIKELTETTSRSKSNTHRIDKLEEQTELMYEMNMNIALIAKQTETTEKTVTALREDVEEIKGKPNKLLDKMKENALGIVVATIVGALIGLVM